MGDLEVQLALETTAPVGYSLVPYLAGTDPQPTAPSMAPAESYVDFWPGGPRAGQRR